MFRDDAQRAQVCEALLAPLLLGGLWTPAGPTARARELLDAGRSGLTSSESMLLRLAWVLWDGSEELSVKELLTLAPTEGLTTFGWLLLALQAGPQGVDEWLSAQRATWGERH